MEAPFVFVLTCFLLLSLLQVSTAAFSSLPVRHERCIPTKSLEATVEIHESQLHMIGRIFRRDKKNKGNRVQTLEREDTKRSIKKKKENDPLWRVMLYNTEYQPDIVARILASVIPSLDRKAAFELCIFGRSAGKVTLVITRKKQAELYCLGLQRQGLPATIEPHDVER